jgi:hypothetical protein
MVAIVFREWTMREEGWECNTCGYTPDTDELRSGSCPMCSESRLGLWRALPRTLDALPLGSTMHVMKKASGRRWGSDEWREWEYTLFMWTLVERDAEGKAVWRSEKGHTTYTDALGVDHHTIVSGYAETRYHDPLRMTSEAVSHFTLGEMTYGAWYVIHDITETPSIRTRRRLMEDMNWPPQQAV